MEGDPKQEAIAGKVLFWPSRVGCVSGTWGDICESEAGNQAEDRDLRVTEIEADKVSKLSCKCLLPFL